MSPDCDEPADVLHYLLAHPDFPQEPTSDQYFDEAQWESYRRLGEHIASRLFQERAPDGSGGWYPGLMTRPRFEPYEAEAAKTGEP
jgi:hypothetical protein